MIRYALGPSFIGLTMALIIATGCQPECVIGEGAITSKEVKLDDVRSIDLAGSMDVLITHGTPQRIIVSGPLNLIDRIDLTLSGDQCKIKSKGCFKTDRPVRIEMTLPRLSEVVLEGSGSITSSNTILTGDLMVTNEGSGSVELSVDAGFVDANVEGSGAIKLMGVAQRFHAAVQGSGSILAADLRNEDAVCEVEGSGNIEVQSSGEIKAVISGSGNILYGGFPTKVEKKEHGSGQVRPLE